MFTYISMNWFRLEWNGKILFQFLDEIDKKIVWNLCILVVVLLNERIKLKELNGV